MHNHADEVIVSHQLWGDPDEAEPLMVFSDPLLRSEENLHSVSPSSVGESELSKIERPPSTVASSDPDKNVVPLPVVCRSSQSPLSHCCKKNTCNYNRL